MEKNEGEILRKRLKNSELSMGQIASLLGMTRQNLSYHLRKDVLEDDFKRLLKEKMKIDFANGNHNHFPLQNNDIQFTDSLKAQIKILENHCSFLQRTYEEKISSLETNLKESLSNQVVMMRQIAVLTRFEAERYSAGDKKKLHDEMDKINKAIDAVMS